MNFIYSFLAFIIFLLVCFFIFKKITRTKYWRIRTNIKAYNREKKKTKKLIKDNNKKQKDFITNDNKVKNIIVKIHNKKEIEIPLVAFDFIYRKINKISTIDENGNLKTVRKKENKKLKQTVINFLENEDTNIIKLLLFKKIKKKLMFIL